MNGSRKCGIMYIYPMGYYSTLNNKEILSFATTWVYLDIIMLSETSQVRKRNTIMHALTGEIPKRLFSQKQRIVWWLPRAGGMREMGICWSEHKVSVRQDTELMYTMVTTVNNIIL